MELRSHFRRHEILVWVVVVAFVATVPYGVINAFTQHRAATALDTWVDRAIPFTAEWEYVYAWFLLFAFLPVAVIRDRLLFRRVAYAYLTAYAIGNAMFLLFPTRIARPRVADGGFLEWGIQLNHWLDGPNNCFPSMHVCGAVLASLCVLGADPLVGGLALTWALLIAVSTLALKAHFLVDVLAALLLACAVWAVFVRPIHHEGPRRSRWLLALLPVAFTAVVALLFAAYRVGVQIPASSWDALPTQSDNGPGQQGRVTSGRRVGRGVPMSRPKQVDVAGVLVSSEAEAVRLVEAQLHGVGPWSAKTDSTDADGLERALDAAGPYLPTFARTLARHLEDADVSVRTLAVFLCERAAKEIGPLVIAKALDRSPKLFDGVKPVGLRTHHPDLRWTLLVALGRAVGQEHTDAIAVLRKAAYEERGTWLLSALARVDLAWLLTHARTVVPQRALGGTLIGMQDTAARVALVRALAPWTPADKQAALAGPFWAIMKDAAEVRAALEQE